MLHQYAAHIGETAERQEMQQTWELQTESWIITALPRHHFILSAKETVGPWNFEASEYITELGKKIIQIKLKPL